MEHFLCKTEWEPSSRGLSLVTGDDWLSINENLFENPVNEDPNFYYDHSRAEVANKLFAELEEPSTEPLESWFEQPIDFSVFDEFQDPVPEVEQTPDSPNPEECSTSQPSPSCSYESVQEQNQESQAFLEEFESIYGSIGSASFPSSNANSVEDEDTPTFDFSQIENDLNLKIAAEHDGNSFLDTPLTMSPMLQEETEMESEESRGEIGDKSSDLPLEDSKDDPDWSETSIEETRDKKHVTPVRRRKAYQKITSSEERKSRKKEQNKNAATRYRIKKKEEIHLILEEEQQLLEKRGQLQEKANDIQREIRFMKGLMRDLQKAKATKK